MFVFAVISAFSMAGFFKYLSTTPYAHGAVRVACVGDSITHGSYPDQLQDLLGSDYKVVNFGVNGAGASADSKLPYMQQHAFPQAQNFRPDIVVIMLGTNDAHANNTADLANFQASYEEIIRQFEALPGDQQIYVMDPPPILNNTLDLSNETLVEDVIPQINQVADDLNLPTINIYAAMINHIEVLGDGVHPSYEGAGIIANQVYDALTSLEQQNTTPPPVDEQQPTQPSPSSAPFSPPATADTPDQAAQPIG